MAIIDILLLFEHSGLAAQPFTERGFNTAIVDLKNAAKNDRATYTLQLDILANEQILLDYASEARLVIGMPPCTDLAVSGAKHFERKAWIDPNFQKKAMSLFRSPERIANGKTPFVIENPKSMASTFWRKPNAIIHPFEYGGYLPEDDKHPDWPEYIYPRDAYPKETMLWFGNGFELPAKKRIEQQSIYSGTFKKLGGKSEKTKEIRSASPRGFFVALAENLLKTQPESSS